MTSHLWGACADVSDASRHLIALAANRMKLQRLYWSLLWEWSPRTLSAMDDLHSAEWIAQNQLRHSRLEALH